MQLVYFVERRHDQQLAIGRMLFIYSGACLELSSQESLSQASVLLLSMLMKGVRKEVRQQQAQSHSMGPRYSGGHPGSEESSLSMSEAEYRYVAAGAGAQEAIWGGQLAEESVRPGESAG